MEEISKNNRGSRRFIAGARCPKCGAQDSLYAVDDTNRVFACIDCKEKIFDDPITQPIKIVDKKSS